MKNERLGCFGQTWNLLWMVILVLSILFALWAFSLSGDAYVLRLASLLATVTSSAGTVYQVYKKKPDGFLNAVKHEFFITRKSIAGTAVWIVNRNQEIIEGVAQKQTDDIKSHIDKSHTNAVPKLLFSASQAVKNAYLALDSVDGAHRKAAILTLRESDDPKAVDALELAVQHLTPSVRVDAALALAEKTDGKNESALPGLLEALDAPDSDTRENAVKSIGKIFQEIPSSVAPTTIAKLIDVLDDMDIYIRWLAESVLISKCHITLPYLIEAISDDSRIVRIGALEAIWIISDNHTLPRQDLISAVPALIEVLTDYWPGTTPRDKTNISVSKLAAKILVKIAPIEQLSAYLQNDQTWMHEHVRKILEQIQNKDNLVHEAETIEIIEEKGGSEIEMSNDQQSHYSYTIDEEINSIDREDLLILVEQTRNIMIDYSATDKGFSGTSQWKAEQEYNYSKNRAIILGLADDLIVKLIPRSLKTHATLSSFRSIMQDLGGYRVRSSNIQESFSALIDHLESK